MFNKQSELTNEEILKLISDTITKHQLKDSLGSSLTGHVISELIEFSHNIRISPFTIELKLADNFPDYVRQQQERIKSFRKFYFISRKGDKNE